MAARSEDLRLYYSRDLVRTYALSAGTGASAALAAPLPPGRYKAHIQPAPGANVVWLRLGTVAIPATATAAAPCTPFDGTVNPSAEFNVYQGVNDLPAAIAVGATCTIYFTRISDPAGAAR